MCYNIAIFSSMNALEAHFNAQFINSDEYHPYYHVSSFSLPKIPIITNKDPKKIQLFTWGMIPPWVRTQQQAEDIQQKTMNARAETIYQKASFHHAAHHNHCLVLIDGFFEWHHHQGKNYPYFIRMKSHEPFALAGLWEQWTNKKTDTTAYTFTIITTPANTLMAHIHNKKKRMPAILPFTNYPQWLTMIKNPHEALHYLKPYDDTLMDAYTISKLITAKNKNSKAPHVLTPFSYPELTSASQQQSMFSQ